MQESKYEKYIIREAMRPEADADPKSWAPYPDRSSVPPYLFHVGENPIKGRLQFLETSWIWGDTIIGNTKEKPPHYHSYEEEFLVIGTNEKDPNDLGAEVDFWMGQGEEAGKITFSTSSLIFVPGNLPHLPFVSKNVTRPILIVVMGINVKDEMPTQVPMKVF